jgi:hypothetical protein
MLVVHHLLLVVNISVAYRLVVDLILEVSLGTRPIIFKL